MKTKIEFADYSEALEWIETRAKSYKSKNDFYASEEFKAIYPLIRTMYEVEQAAFAKKGMAELEKLGLKVGSRVYYDFASPYFSVTRYTGTIVQRSGVPYVKLDDGQKTMTGKKSVRWHKGFIGLTVTEVRRFVHELRRAYQRIHDQRIREKTK